MMPKILIAEDDIPLGKAYQTKLTKSGFEVKLVTDGDELLATLITWIPDLIILDLMMPKKNGFETLVELKSSEHFKDIPVIVATNSGQPEEVDKAIKLGAVGYIVKSDMSLAKVVEKIRASIKTS